MGCVLEKFRKICNLWGALLYLGLISCSQSQNSESESKYLLKFQPPTGSQLNQIVEITTNWKKAGDPDTSTMILSVLQELKSDSNQNGDYPRVQYQAKKMKSLIETQGQVIHLNTSSVKTDAEFAFKMKTQVRFEFDVNSKYKVMKTSVNVDSLIPEQSMLVGSLGLDSNQAVAYRLKLRDKLQNQMLDSKESNVFGFYEGLFPDSAVGVLDTWRVLLESEQSALKSVYMDYTVMSRDSNTMSIQGLGIVPMGDSNAVADTMMSNVQVDLKSGWILESDIKIQVNEPEQVLQLQSRTITTSSSGLGS